MRHVLIVTAVALLATSTASASPSIGRQGIMLDVHGYHTGQGVVVPVRGIAEWLGAVVDFRSPHISITLGPKKIRLTLGSSAVTVNGSELRLSTPPARLGDTTCVPVRFVGEVLGCQVQYVPGSQAIADLAVIDHVQLKRGNTKAIVLIHRATPDTVSRIIKAARDEAGGRGLTYGQDYIVWVVETAKDWGGTAQRWWDGHGDGSTHTSDHIYQLTPSGWVHRCATSRGYVRASYLREVGIPVSVARKFGWEVFDE